jgi:hypothetical protein
MVAIERRIGPGYDEAWSWALAMTRAQRQARRAALRARSTTATAASMVYNSHMIGLQTRLGGRPTAR